MRLPLFGSRVKLSESIDQIGFLAKISNVFYQRLKQVLLLKSLYFRQNFDILGDRLELLQSVCTKQVMFPYTEHAASGL